MEKTLLPYEHLKIQLEEIKAATNNFDPNRRIGVGGFGPVYRGEVSHSQGRSMAAIKRLNPKMGQGIPEFLKEITMLSSYRHENLICLLGFCCEGREMIIVYELASHGSLNDHLSSPDLTWTQRVKLCLDVAKGLSYLHDPRETHQRLIHCDIKSGNILLDDQWNAKVSDFGLSIMGSANEQHSLIVTLAAGTRGYIDPQYEMTHTLTKESDVYSFGVVLFEVLCGKLCCMYKTNGNVEKNFVPTWIESYKQSKLADIIYKVPNNEPMEQSALKVFSDIAYQCLMESREDRPKMVKVVTELETALQYQEYSEWIPVSDYHLICISADAPLNSRSKVEFRKLLSEGIFLNGGKTWFSMNKKGEHCKMISVAECLDSAPPLSHYNRILSSEYNSRFVMGPFEYKNPRFKTPEDTHMDGDSRRIRHRLITHAKNFVFKFKPPKKEEISHPEDWILKTRLETQFLSPGITYSVNFVFKCKTSFTFRNEHEFILLRYRLQGEAKSSISFVAVKRENGWRVAELYHFTSDSKILDLEILFEGFSKNFEVIFVDGFEFWPLEKVELEDENHLISNSDANWENKLPIDYEDIMRRSKNSVHWTTKKEAYSIIRKGFLINNGQEKCHMISARVSSLLGHNDRMLSLPESRFGEAFECTGRLDFDIQIACQLLSSETTYASYLVYRLPEDQSEFEGPIIMWDERKVQIHPDRQEQYNRWYIYLISPLPPIITKKTDVKRPIIKGHPQHRSDGWMEVQIWEFETDSTTEMIPMHLKSFPFGVVLNGLIIGYIEFRPI